MNHAHLLPFAWVIKSILGLHDLSEPKQRIPHPDTLGRVQGRMWLAPVRVGALAGHCNQVLFLALSQARRFFSLQLPVSASSVLASPSLGACSCRTLIIGWICCLPRAVAVHQNRQQGRGMVGLGATTRILAGQLGEIESIDDLNNEARQVRLAEPVLDRWEQQVVSFAVGRDEVGDGQNHLSG